MAKLDKFIIDNTTYELVPEIAPLFNSATSYSVGDCVIHDAVLYKFTANHAAGAWTGNDVEAIEVADRLNKISDSVAPEFSASASYTAGSYVYKNGVLYKFTADHTGAWTGTDAEVVTVGGEVTDLKSAINNLDETVTDLVGVNEIITPTWTTSKRLNESGDVVNSGASFGYTDKITVIDADEQKAYGLNSGAAFAMPSLHFYNSSDEHIGYAYADGTVDLKPYITQYSPSYIRISHYATNDRPFAGVTVSYKTNGSLVEITEEISAMEGDISDIDSRTDVLENNVETLSTAVSAAVVTSKKEPYNLLNGIGVTLNKRWQANASSAESANGFTLTDLIPVESNKLYAFVTDDSLYGAGYGDLGFPVYFAQFAADKSIILQSDSGYGISVLTGQNTKYVAISFASGQSEKHPVFANAPFTGNLSNPSNEITDTFKSVSADEISFTQKNEQYVNLLEGHRKSVVHGKNLVNGKVTTNANFMTLTDYIPCDPSTDYNGAITVQTDYNPTFGITWYTSDGIYISKESHANNTAFTSPATAAYFRIEAVQKGTSYPNAEENFSRTFFAKTDAQYGPPCVDPSPVFSGIYPNSSLYGKTWAAFGDSITEKNVRATINYHDFIRAETGITVINKGLGGSGYKCRWQNDNNIPALADAFDFTGVDIVTCMAGINDAWTDLTDNMGNADDVYDTSATAQNQSVMACFNYFLDIVITKAPFAKIGIISPIPCYHTQSGTLYDFNPANDNSTLAQFVEKCKASCKHHGIPYLDLFHNSGLRPWDSTVNAAMFKCNAADSPDGLHPNYLGHKYFYPLVREFVKQLG